MTLRILYVDDEPDIREVAAMALELDPELEVRTCASGIEALDVAAQWQPDLVLLDFMMPTMDGPATLAALHSAEATAGIPVVFVTARAQVQELSGTRIAGAVGVIAKPFDPMRFADHAKEFLRR